MLTFRSYPRIRTKGDQGLRQVWSSPVKSGQVLSGRVRSVFWAVGDGKSGRLVAADSGRPDGSCKGLCVLRSWSSECRSPLPQTFVDVSVAQLGAICPGFSLFSSFFVIIRLWPVVLSTGAAARPGCCWRGSGDVLPIGLFSHRCRQLSRRSWFYYSSCRRLPQGIPVLWSILVVRSWFLIGVPLQSTDSEGRVSPDSWVIRRWVCWAETLRFIDETVWIRIGMES